MTATQKRHKSRIDKKALIFYCLMFAFPVAQFCVFYIGVNFNSIILAFKDYDPITGVYTWLGFDNFVRFFNEIFAGNTLTYAIKNSLILWAVTLACGTALALLFSYYIFKNAPLHSLIRVLLYLPSMLPAIAMVIIFMMFSGFGLPALGLKDWFSEADTQFAAVLVFNIWIGFGTPVILYSGAMSQVSADVLEAARVDGVNSLQEFFRIVLPSIYPTICTFLVTGVAGIFINQANLYSFFSYDANEKIYTIGYYLFVQIAGQNTGISAYPYAAAGGLLLTVVAVPVTMLVKFLLEKFGPSED